MIQELVEVAPREGRVSRNLAGLSSSKIKVVAPREGRVSRNDKTMDEFGKRVGRAPRGACE